MPHGLECTLHSCVFLLVCGLCFLCRKFSGSVASAGPTSPIVAPNMMWKQRVTKVGGSVSGEDSNGSADGQPLCNFISWG